MSNSFPYKCIGKQICNLRLVLFQSIAVSLFLILREMDTLSRESVYIFINKYTFFFQSF